VNMPHFWYGHLGLDHGVGHFVEMTFQKGLQPGSSLAIFSHDIHA
jgi:hypothetical protein